MRRLLAGLLAVTLVIFAGAEAAVRGRDAMYVGGTLQNLAQNSKGTLAFEESQLLFTTKNSKQSVQIPYKGVESIEYGQKAGRRVGVAVVVSPLFLLSKKKKHFITLGFVTPEGKKEGAVFEVAKGILADTLRVLETKTGKKVEYESEDAKKQVEKN